MVGLRGKNIIGQSETNGRAKGRLIIRNGAPCEKEN